MITLNFYVTNGFFSNNTEYYAISAWGDLKFFPSGIFTSDIAWYIKMDKIELENILKKEYCGFKSVIKDIIFFETKENANKALEYINSIIIANKLGVK